VVKEGKDGTGSGITTYATIAEYRDKLLKDLVRRPVGKREGVHGQGLCCCPAFFQIISPSAPAVCLFGWQHGSAVVVGCSLLLLTSAADPGAECPWRLWPWWCVQEGRPKPEPLQAKGGLTGRKGDAPTLLQVFKGEVNSWLKDGPNGWPCTATTSLVLSDLPSEDSLDDVDGGEAWGWGAGVGDRMELGWAGSWKTAGGVNGSWLRLEMEVGRHDGVETHPACMLCRVVVSA
jgi:hypothetical protein